MRGRIIGKIEEGTKNNRMLPGVSTSLTALFHGCGSHLKTTGMCSRRHGEVVLEVRRLQKRQIYRPISKRTGAPQLSRWQNQFLAASGKQISRKNRYQTFEGRRTIRTQTVVCVPLTRQQL
ncbi:hypothetical protein TNCV_4862371 [Trichonephila clavipes]|nr:hypothetical protein TNCV_4862371 [Trichonephila clavipes]